MSVGARRRMLGSLLAAAGAGWGMRAARADEAGTWLLATHPYLAPAELRRRFQPLAQALAGAVGHPMAVRVGASYLEHERYVGEDVVDVAFIGPGAYVHVVARYGRKPILARVETNGRPETSGVLFVRRDSPLRIPAELKGKRVAFGNAESATGAVVPRYMLLQAGVRLADLADYVHLNSHDDVVLAVASGDFDAGAMRADLFEEVAPARGLRALLRLPPVSEHLFVCRRTLPDADQRRLRAAMLGLRDTTQGTAALKALGGQVTGLVASTDSDYDSLRRMMRALEGAG